MRDATYPMIFCSMGKTERFASPKDVPYKKVDISPNYTLERAEGLLVPREELDEQPIYEDFLGPMWDGDCFRYETQAVYDILST